MEAVGEENTCGEEEDPEYWPAGFIALEPEHECDGLYLDRVGIEAAANARPSDGIGALRITANGEFLCADESDPAWGDGTCTCLDESECEISGMTSLLHAFLYPVTGIDVGDSYGVSVVGRYQPGDSTDRLVSNVRPGLILRWMDE